VTTPVSFVLRAPVANTTGFASVYVRPAAPNEAMCPRCLHRWRTSASNEPWPRVITWGPGQCIACGTGKPKEGW
jgi:hypothetical protein